MSASRPAPATACGRFFLAARHSVATATGVANHNQPPLNPRQQRKWPRERSRDHQRKRRTERRRRKQKRPHRTGVARETKRARRAITGGTDKKTPTENGWGFVIGGGAAPRIKRLLKVRNRSAEGCCELVRTGSKRLPVRPSVVDDQAGFSPRLVTGKSVQPRMLFEVSSIPETGIEPASVATANNTPNYTHSWAR